jgi:hypothetical protein
MQHDLSKPSDAARRLSLKNVTIGEAREHLIGFISQHWERSLTTLAQKLRDQGFSQAETLDLAESFRPMFEKNLKEVVQQFDANADAFFAQCRAGEIEGHA